MQFKKNDNPNYSMDIARQQNNQAVNTTKKRPDASIASPSDFTVSFTMKSEGFESKMSMV